MDLEVAGISALLQFFEDSNKNLALADLNMLCLILD